MQIYWRLFDRVQLKQRVSIGLRNTLSPNRLHAIIWTDSDQDLWFHMAPQGHNVLI